MAEKRVSVRLAAVGGKQVRSELEGVGGAGAKGFGRISKEAEAANAKLAAFSRRVKIAAAVAVGAAAAAGVAMVKSGLETIDAQAKLAASLGTTTSSIQVLERAGGLAGVSMGEIEQASKKLTTRLSEAAGGTGTAVDALKRLHLTATDLQALPLDERIAAIQDALAKFVPPAERAAVASALFGDKAALAFSRIDSATLRLASKDIADFGVAVSEQDVAQIETTNDAISRLGLVWLGLTNQLTVAAAPALENVANAMAAATRVGGTFQTSIAFLGQNIGEIASVAGAFATFFAGRFVYAMGAAALGLRGVTLGLVALKGALIRTGVGALIVGMGELAYRTDLFGGSTDNVTLAMGQEIQQANTLLESLANGATMSTAMATAKLAEARTHLSNAEAMRQEQIAAVQSSRAGQEIQTVLDSMNRTLAGIINEQHNFAPNFDRGEIDDFIARMADAKAEQAALLAGASELSPEYVAVTEKIAALEAAIAGAKNGVITFEGHVITAEEVAARLAATAAGINLANANASAAELVAKFGIALGLATTLAGLGLGANAASLASDERGSQRAISADARQVGTDRTMAAVNARVAALAKAASGTGTGTGTGAATAADSIDQITQAYDSLMASLDPAIAASQKFDESQKTINDALAAGVITTTEAAHAMDLLTAAAGTGAGAWDAISKSLADYAASARNIGADIGNSLVGAFHSAENAIGNFVRTGKLDFNDLITSMIADLAELAARQFILGPIANVLSGALGGAGGIFANIQHAGGMVGAPGPGRMVPAMAFAGAPRMHSGGFAGIRPDEVPAILQRGERVLSRREATSYGQSSAPIVNVTIMARDAESFRQSRTQVASDIARAVSLGRRGM